MSGAGEDAQMSAGGGRAPGGNGAGPGGSGWRRSPTWMKVLLIASLSLNLAVAGVVGGRALHAWQVSKAVRAAGFDRRQARLLQMVPEERRDEVQAMLRARRAEIERARREMHEATLAFIEALRSEPFDPERVAAALARRQEASRRYWTINSQEVAEIARQLDARERAELARRLEAHARRLMARLGGKHD